MLKTSIMTSAMALSLFTTTPHANECLGQVYGVNAGRGDVGLLFALNEKNGTASAHSVSLFSSAALAYDSTSKRMYYSSAPQPATYEVDVSHLSLSNEQLKHLPISGAKFKRYKLAYFDYASAQHVIVGQTKQLLGMVYDPVTDSLLGESYGNLYQIDKNTGETTKLGSLNSPEGYHRGDLVIKDETLYMVTASALYVIDRTTYALTKVSNLDLKLATGATLAQNGKILVSEVINNDYGYTNKTRLFELDPTNGSTCYITTVPARINDLTTNFDESAACYTTSLCEENRPSLPEISVQPIVSETVEGGNLEYLVQLSGAYDQDITLSLNIIDGTTTSDDYEPIAEHLLIPAGETTATVIIETIDDNEYSESLSLTLNVSALENATGSASAAGTILNDDAQCTPIQYTRLTYQFVSEESLNNNDWGIRVNGQYVKLLDEHGGSGTYDILASSTFNYVLAINGNSGNLTTKYRVYGNTQYWEDQNDGDYNDFVVNVTTQSITKGCQ